MAQPVISNVAISPEIPIVTLKDLIETFDDQKAATHTTHSNKPMDMSATGENNKMTQSVLILGAGELGLSVLEALHRHPSLGTTKLGVLLRPASINSTSSEKQRANEHLKSMNITLEPGDVVEDSTSHLATIFAKYEMVVSCNGMSQPPGTQLKLSEAVLQARQAGGCKRYIPWQFGMDYDVIGQGSSQDLFDEQLKVREMLRAQKEVDWTIISTGLFMSFLVLPAFGVVDIPNRTVHALGSWDNQITLTTPHDIGVVTAEVILKPEGITDHIVYTAGDTKSYGEIAQLVEERFGGEWEKEVWNMEELEEQVKKDEAEKGDGMPKYRATFGAGRGVAWDKAKTINAERGIATTDIRAYLKDIDT